MAEEPLAEEPLAEEPLAEEPLDEDRPAPLEEEPLDEDRPNLSGLGARMELECSVMIGSASVTLVTRWSEFS